MAALQTARDLPLAAPAWHAIPGLEASRALGVDPSAGLPGEDAARRLATAGPNRIAGAEAEPRARAFLRQYQDSMQVVLTIAGVGSLALGQPGTGIVVLALTLFNAVLGLQ
jgi:P-type Ca2+ transporter type 2C